MASWFESTTRARCSQGVGLPDQRAPSPNPRADPTALAAGLWREKPAGGFCPGAIRAKRPSVPESCRPCSPGPLGGQGLSCIGHASLGVFRGRNRDRRLSPRLLGPSDRVGLRRSAGDQGQSAEGEGQGSPRRSLAGTRWRPGYRTNESKAMSVSGVRHRGNALSICQRRVFALSAISPCLGRAFPRCCWLWSYSICGTSSHPSTHPQRGSGSVTAASRWPA